MTLQGRLFDGCKANCGHLCCRHVLVLFALEKRRNPASYAKAAAQAYPKDDPLPVVGRGKGYPYNPYSLGLQCLRGESVGKAGWMHLDNTGEIWALGLYHSLPRVQYKGGPNST